MLSEQRLGFEVTDLKNNNEEQELEQLLNNLLSASAYKHRDTATISNWCTLIETGSKINPALYLTNQEKEEFKKYADFNHDMEIEVKDFICLFSMIKSHTASTTQSTNNNNNNNKYTFSTAPSMQQQKSSPGSTSSTSSSLRPSKIPIHQQKQLLDSPRASSNLKTHLKSSSSSSLNSNTPYPTNVSYGIVETIHSRPMDRNNTDSSFRSRSTGKRVSIDPTILQDNEKRNNNNSSLHNKNSLQTFDVIPNSFPSSNTPLSNDYSNKNEPSRQSIFIESQNNTSTGNQEEYQDQEEEGNQDENGEDEEDIIEEDDDEVKQQRHQEDESEPYLRPYRWKSMESEDIKRQLDHDRMVQLENEISDLKNELKFYKHQSEQQQTIEHHYQQRLKEMETEVKTLESLQKSNDYEHEKIKKKYSDEIQQLKSNLGSTTKQLNDTYAKLHDSQSLSMKAVELQNEMEKTLQQNQIQIDKLEIKAENFEQLKLDFAAVQQQLCHFRDSFYNTQAELNNHLKRIPSNMTVEKVEESLRYLDELKKEYSTLEFKNGQTNKELEAVTKECEELKRTLDDLHLNEIAQLPGENLKIADLSFLEKDHLDKEDKETILSMNKQLAMQSHVIRQIRISKQYKLVNGQGDTLSTWKKMIPIYILLFFMVIMNYYQYYNNQYKSYGLLPCKTMDNIEYANDNGTVLRKIISWIDKLILSDATDIIQPY